MLFFEAGGMCSYHGASLLVNKWSVVCVNGTKLIMEIITIISWLQQLKLCLYEVGCQAMDQRIVCNG